MTHPLLNSSILLGRRVGKTLAPPGVYGEEGKKKTEQMVLDCDKYSGNRPYWPGKK